MFYVMKPYALDKDLLGVIFLTSIGLMRSREQAYIRCYAVYAFLILPDNSRQERGNGDR